MCFSAAASFTTGAILLGIGTSTWRMARGAGDRPLAAMPLLFGLQQVVEGVVWTGLADAGSPAHALVTGIYAFFSHVLWPVYVPLAAWLVESQSGRRRALALAVAGGLVLGAYILSRLAGDQLVARAVGGHLEYINTNAFGPPVMLAYLAVTVGSLSMSSHSCLRFFGVLAFAAFLMAWLVFATWLISIWCFFAALLSAIVWLYFAAGPASAASGIHRLQLADAGPAAGRMAWGRLLRHRAR